MAFFKEEDMNEWEKKPPEQQTLKIFKEYFGEIYKDKKKYTNAMANQTRFVESAALVEEKNEADDATAMLTLP